MMLRSLPLSPTVRSSTSRSVCACAATRRSTRMIGSTASEPAACASVVPPDRDAPARTAPCDRRASPCRCPAARRSARHAACGRRDRLEQRAARPRRGRTGWRFRADAAPRPSSSSSSLTAPRPRACSGAVAGSSRLFTMVQMFSATVLARLARVDQDAAVRLGCGELPIGLAQLLVESRAPRPRNGRPRRRRAVRWRARAPPRPATSRMMVRSGLVSPTVIFSSRAISRASTWPSTP